MRRMAGRMACLVFCSALFGGGAEEFAGPAKHGCAGSRVWHTSGGASGVWSLREVVAMGARFAARLWEGN